MDTRFIEAMIENLVSGQQPDPDLCDLLAAVSDRNRSEAGEDDLHRAAAFVLAYIDQVPYMIKVASTSASNLGLQDEMNRILETVASYWKEGDDVIPDELGVIGLLDDAYCSLTLLQSVSDNYRMITG